jgi:hypothetical protein
MVTIEMYIGLLLSCTKAFEGHIEMEARSIALGRTSFIHLFSRHIVVTSCSCSYLRQLTVRPRALFMMICLSRLGQAIWRACGVLPSSEAQPSNVALKLMTFNIATAVTRSTRLV